MALPSFLSHEGVATGVVSPTRIINRGVIADAPADLYHANVGRDVRLAAAEPRAHGPVVSRVMQAHAGADAACEEAPVLLASHVRHRAAADGSELVAC